ncbi:enoyl-CoA hydratase/isomerase family protein [Alcaligenaceae bacterium CGII-47]|nr:enoyl-CoA hydratase/isomerase family protein [Alcaligenaceae bacterium CGII-47]
MIENELIKVTINAGIAQLSINRPKAMNALSFETVSQLNQNVIKLEERGDIRVLIIRGENPAFCAGGDLKFFKEKIKDRDIEGFRRFLNLCGETFRRIEAFPCPTIAMVNGIAVAGGLELILSCDLVIAAASAKIGDGHANFGVIPGGGSAIRLPRKIPVTLAKYLLFTGRLLPASELVAWGLVNKVVPDEQLEQAVEEIAADIVKNSPLGLRITKQLVNDGLQQSIDTALNLEISAWDGYGHSYDILEGLNAFEEKRKPKFKGK